MYPGTQLDPILVAILETGRQPIHNMHSPHVKSSLARNGDYVRLHRGMYLSKRRWSVMSFEDRHLATMLAVHMAAVVPPVFSHISAAILHRLPIYGEIDKRAHVITSVGGAGKPGIEIVRHRYKLDDADVATVKGLRCTSLARTLFDLARHAPPRSSAGGSRWVPSQ